MVAIQIVTAEVTQAGIPVDTVEDIQEGIPEGMVAVIPAVTQVVIAEDTLRGIAVAILVAFKLCNFYI